MCVDSVAKSYRDRKEETLSVGFTNLAEFISILIVAVVGYLG